MIKNKYVPVNPIRGIIVAMNKRKYGLFLLKYPTEKSLRTALLSPKYPFASPTALPRAYTYTNIYIYTYKYMHIYTYVYKYLYP
jgi:hypothetical protein